MREGRGEMREGRGENSEGRGEMREGRGEMSEGRGEMREGRGEKKESECTPLSTCLVQRVELCTTCVTWSMGLGQEKHISG